MALRAIPVTLADAQAFVGSLHRHHKAPIGHRFSIGCADATGQLRGVAVIGRPVARKTPQYTVAEVTRLCTDGTKNACSFLYATAARIARDMGFQRIQTFLLADESGVSLKAASWTFDGMTEVGGWGTRSNRNLDNPGSKQRWIKTLK